MILLRVWEADLRRVGRQLILRYQNRGEARRQPRQLRARGEAEAGRVAQSQGEAEAGSS